MCEKKITNEDVLNFYVEKGVKYDNEGAEELIKEYYPSPKGDYAKLAGTFISISNGEEEKEEKEEKEDICFYNWLKEQEKQNFSETLSLAKVVEKDESFKDFIFKPDLDNPLIEKWHLYVSWYALKEYRGKKKKTEYNEYKEFLDMFNENDATKADIGILQPRITCRRLLLWMYEASLSKDSIDDKNHKADIEKRLKEVMELKKKEQDLIKDVKDKIAENIAKYKKEQQK